MHQYDFFLPDNMAMKEDNMDYSLDDFMDDSFEKGMVNSSINT